MDTIFNGGVALILLLQSLGDGFIILMKGFTFLGNEAFFLLFFPLLYWCIDSELGLRVGVILLLSGTVNTYVKWILHLPRPYWYSPKVTAYTAETSFGAPSGHAQNAVAVWGLIASSIGKPWAWAAAAVLMFGIGLSRMALGVHFYLDMLLGWLLGALLLWAFLRFEKPVTGWVRAKNLAAQVGTLFGISLGMILAGKLILLLLGGWDIPAEWVQNAANAFPNGEPITPFALSGLITNAAVLFGATSGAVVMNALGGFDPKGARWKRALRYVLGIIGVLLVYLGMKAIFPGGDNWVGYIFRFVRYAIVSAWTTLFAPLIFIKIHLAKRKRP